MIHDANAGHVPHKDVPDSQDDEFAPSVRVRHAARRVYIHIDTDHRLRKAAAAVSRPNRLTLEPGDLGYFWRDEHGWSPELQQWCRTRVNDTTVSTFVDES